MPDLYAISQAIAARFASGQVTPPATYQNVRVATANPTNAMAPLPCVMVFPDSGSFDTGNGTRIGVHTFTVRFYYNQAGDIARDAVALQKWVTVLADQLKLSVQLGGTVARATIDGYKVGYLNYGGKDYSGIEFQVSALTTEGWAAVA
jgi:hypothetical protein